MKKILVALMLSISVSAFAASQTGLSSNDVSSAGFAKLSESEKAEILKQVADKAATKDIFGGTKEASEDKVERWVKIGSNIGQGLAGAAKEVGVAVNDFANTPVGQLTMMLIVWHMMGGTLVHIFGGLMIWIVGFSAIRYFFKQAYPNEVTYSTTQKNIFGNFAIEKVEKTVLRDDNASGWLFASAVVLVAGLVAIFTF